jgi:predicted Rossmann fold flavoprotein
LREAALRVEQYDTLILGAGAAGMMCAAHAGGRVLIVDHAKAPGEKIRISGGGRCNFTNLETVPERFISSNPHFHKSALSRYTQWDFLDLVTRHKIPWHEKTLGQLFCDTSAKDIIAMLLSELQAAKAELRLNTSVGDVAARDGAFEVTLESDGATRPVRVQNLVVASGGKSIPKMGASGLAYRIAEDFGHGVTETRPALVPFTFGDDLAGLKALAGLSVQGRASANGTAFDEAILFTHRGLSGPAILQISSYWREGDEVVLSLCPKTDVGDALRVAKRLAGRKQVVTALADYLPARLATEMAARLGIKGNLADRSDARLDQIGAAINAWHLKPTATEGYRTAEVTLGGIDTSGLSSQTMMSQTVRGLYFIGEAVDVTGWLGGYNFQWAWSSGWVAGQAIRVRV